MEIWKVEFKDNYDLNDEFVLKTTLRYLNSSIPLRLSPSATTDPTHPLQIMQPTISHTFFSDIYVKIANAQYYWVPGQMSIYHYSDVLFAQKLKYNKIAYVTI